VATGLRAGSRWRLRWNSGELPEAVSGLLARRLAGFFESPALGASSLLHFLFGGLRRLDILAQAGGAGGGGPADFLFGNMMIPLVITMVLMYLLLMRPEQKKRKEMERLLATIKKNDHVVTVGGIYGTVVSAIADSKFVTIRVDDSNGTKLKVLRSAISHVGAPEEAEAEAKAGE
jgi:preprotein translocase subunit YajC